MMINYHPALSWYNLLLFAIFVIAFCLWARGKVLRKYDDPSPELMKGDDIEYQWWAIVTYEGESVMTYPIDEVLTEFCRRFHQWGTFLVSLGQEIGCLRYAYDGQCTLFQDVVVVFNRAENSLSVGGTVQRMVRGEILSLLWYPVARPAEEERLRYSEIDESGVLDRPKRLLFSVHYASSPFTDFQGKRCQCVILVPANDQLHRNNRPFLLIADISSSSEAAGE